VHTEGVFFLSIFEKFSGNFGYRTITAMLTADIFLAVGNPVRRPIQQISLICGFMEKNVSMVACMIGSKGMLNP